MLYRVSCFFFFQAEDGIRDLVRSRGLGDVYKRQQQPGYDGSTGAAGRAGRAQARVQRARRGPGRSQAVSYTHLTLPTSDLV